MTSPTRHKPRHAKTAVPATMDSERVAFGVADFELFLAGEGGNDMAAVDGSDDTRAIQALIGGHFQGLRWSENASADWETFRSDFLPDASLFPAARPVRRQTLDAFIGRMTGLAQGTLRSFEEETLGMHVLVFSNVAVVLAASRMLENGADVNHDVSGYLLVKSEGAWRIAAPAWDHATDQSPVPESLRHT